MNDEITPDAPKFDLFATEVEDNLKEELAKGTFQWTNKYTKVLGTLFVIVGLLSVGTWYGHYEAGKSTTLGASSGEWVAMAAHREQVASDKTPAVFQRLSNKRSH